MSKDDDPLLGDDEDDGEFVVRPRKFPARFVELLDDLARAQGVRLANPDAEPYKMGRFEVFRILGEGGMSLVFAALDPDLNRKVALKLWALPGQGLADEVVREAKLLARLSHPNVVTIYETGRWGDDVFIVMEYVDGENAGHWAMRMPSPSWREILDVYVAAGHGLAAAHDKQILHGDVKPSNILIGGDGRVRMADFGLAEILRGRGAEEDAREAADLGLDLPAPRRGTLVYMAPERLEGRRGDARSDQFSYCASMWEALHAALPHAGETREELLESIDQGELQVGEAAVKAVPKRLQKLLRTGLARDPDDRHADMATLIQELRDVPGDRRRRNIFFYTLVGAFLCVGLGALGAALVMESSRTTPGSATQPPTPAQATPDPKRRSSVGDRVMELISRGEYETADWMWTTELELRHSNGEPVAADSLLVGHLFVQAAQAHRESAPALAAKLAGYAANAAFAAQAELHGDGLPTDEADTLIDLARQIGARDAQPFD